MRDIHVPSVSVIVGIDGSRAALTAALWAVDEAVDRDIPLRLVYAIDPCADGPADPADAARKLATAEIAVRQAVTAVESTDKPVKIEVEILQERPSQALLNASRSAAMLCVGALGLRSAAPDRVGSTAAALAATAHCPVAIIRRYDACLPDPGVVVAEIDSSPESETVLERGIAEALLRGTELRVVAAWNSRCTDIEVPSAAAARRREVQADLDRRLTCWKRTQPMLRVETVAVHGTFASYLSRHAASIQLAVVGRRRSHGLSEMVGAPSYAALKDSDCSVLVCNPHGGL